MTPSPQPESPEPLKVVAWRISSDRSTVTDVTDNSTRASSLRKYPRAVIEDMVLKSDAEAAIQAARNEAEAKPIGNPDWLRCETRRPWVANSLHDSAKKMRASEKRARNAFRKDFMGVPCQYIADAYAEAAAVFEARLNAINAAMKGDAHA